MFYRLLIFTILFSTYAFAKTFYTEKIGTETFAIANTLKLSNDNILFVCQSSSYYIQNTKCHNFVNIHNYGDYHSNRFVYAGYMHPRSRPTSIFYNKWFIYISKYEGLSQIIVTINNKFKNIFERLHKAQQHRKKLEIKFAEYQGINYHKYMKEIDGDIKLLSYHGMNLANVTKRLFNTIKPQIIDAEMRMDVLSARQDTMQGLRSFEREMNRVSKLPQGAIDNSIEDIVFAIDTALTKLERALAK